jgi:hypothetical protein
MYKDVQFKIGSATGTATELKASSQEMVETTLQLEN